MSFLTPLFLLGGLAVALPILFHLIRRSTRERFTFSSLMFLSPTPPRITRRSRLEHILLLLLRALVLCLLALGFARPFFRQSASVPTAEGTVRRVVVLVDTSASMRRQGLWAEAQARVEKILKSLKPADEAAVFTFDRDVHRLVTFQDWNRATPDNRMALALDTLKKVSPGWFETRAGKALIEAAETLQEEHNAQAELTRSREVILVSDLQEGSQLDALQGFEWPKRLTLGIEQVKPRTASSNAGLQLLATSEEQRQEAEGQRIRVLNAPDSRREQFQVGWVKPGETRFLAPPVSLYVPPGQSRIATIPPLPPGTPADQLLLQGDDDDFDNRAFAALVESARVNVVVVSGDPDNDSTQPVFFIQRAFQQTRRENVQLIFPKAADALPLDSAPLAIVADALPPARVQTLREFATSGKTVLVVLKNTAGAASLGALLNQPALAAPEAELPGYAILSEINFQHPLFAPFADPRFSDFTKIHFWKYRKIDATKIPGAQVVARFDTGDPAVVDVPLGRGRVIILTAGWHPTDSQLALSSKFVPLLYSVLDQAGGLGSAPAQYVVGDSIPLFTAHESTNESVTVQKPDGTRVPLPRGTTSFTQTEVPGIYWVTIGTSTRKAAVNLAPEESKTTPLPPDEASRFGATLKSAPIKNPDRLLAEKEHLLKTELEGRQKLWRWLLVAALTVIIFETWLAGRLTRRVAV